MANAFEGEQSRMRATTACLNVFFIVAAAMMRKALIFNAVYGGIYSIFFIFRRRHVRVFHYSETV